LKSFVIKYSAALLRKGKEESGVTYVLNEQYTFAQYCFKVIILIVFE